MNTTQDFIETEQLIEWRQDELTNLIERCLKKGQVSDEEKFRAQRLESFIQKATMHRDSLLNKSVSSAIFRIAIKKAKRQAAQTVKTNNPPI